MPLKIDDTLIQRALAVLRIVSAFLLVQHGTAKHLGFPHVAAFDNLAAFSLPCSTSAPPAPAPASSSASSR